MAFATVRNSLALAVFLLGGTSCSDSSEQDDDSEGVQPVVVDNDLEFIDAMVPHHEMAVMMAEMVLEHGRDARVAEMAQTMKDAQTTEIAELKATRKRIAASEEVPETRDPHMEEDVDRLQAARGGELDRLFLEHMLPHHAGAIQIAHDALPNLDEAKLRTMAERIIADQSKEIGMIQEMLGEM